MFLLDSLVTPHTILIILLSLTLLALIHNKIGPPPNLPPGPPKNSWLLGNSIPTT